MTSYFYFYSPVLNLGSHRVYTSFSLLFTLRKPVKPGAFWTLPPIISTSWQAIDRFAEAAQTQLTGFERTTQYWHWISLWLLLTVGEYLRAVCEKEFVSHGRYQSQCSKSEWRGESQLLLSYQLGNPSLSPQYFWLPIFPICIF